MSLGDTTTHENGFSLPRHRAAVETHSKRLGVRSFVTWFRAPAEELDPDIRTRDFQRSIRPLNETRINADKSAQRVLAGPLRLWRGHVP